MSWKNPYEHIKEPILCKDCIYDITAGTCRGHECPRTDKCIENCPACIAEASYKAGYEALRKEWEIEMSRIDAEGRVMHEHAVASKFLDKMMDEEKQAGRREVVDFIDDPKGREPNDLPTWEEMKKVWGIC